MQILYTPMFSKTDLNSDSNYVLLANFARMAKKLVPDWHIYCTWPNAKSGFRYDNDGLFNLGNITRIPMEFYTGRHLETLAFFPRHWKKLSQGLLYHVHWANDIEKIGSYKALVQSDGKERNPVIIGHHHYMIHPSTGYSIGKDISVLSRQLMGSVIADKVIFNSNHCRAMFLDMAGQFLSSVQTNKILKASSIVHLGPALAGYNKEPDDILTFIYNHRLQAYKNYKDTFELLNELWEEGHRFKVLVTNTSNDNAKQVRKYPFVEFKICCTHQDYFEVLKKAHINITNSQHETFCISAVESMMMGQLLIAPNGVTFPEITGAEINKYPFLFDNKKEQKAILKEIFKNRKLINRWGSVLQKYVLKRFSQAQWAKSHIRIIEEEMEKVPEPKTNQAALQAFLDTCKRNNNQPIPKFLKDLTRQIYFGIGQSWPPFRILRQINSCGYIIKNKNGTQILVKHGKTTKAQ